MRLEKFIKFKGEIECKSGLHIGGSTEGIEIGGVDNPIIKHPLTSEPYIPGSSLKGKLRSSLEKKYERYYFDNNKKEETGEPCNCGICLICRIFGAHKNTKQNLGPTRIIVRDSPLTDDSKATMDQYYREKGQYLELKYENTLDRKKSTANPRSMERVPEGAKFNIEIVLQIFDDDIKQEKELKMIELIKEGLKLVEETYLGGYGSRGSGQIKFNNLQLNGVAFNLDDIQPGNAGI